MKFCFVMDPWNVIKVKVDSTLRMIHESVLRGHTIAIARAQQITAENGVTKAVVQMLKPHANVSTDVITFHGMAEFERQYIPLSEFDAIILRADPPLDLVMLNLLDSIKNDVFIINDVDGLRKGYNKVYVSTFFDEKDNIVPRTCISKDKETLRNFILNAQTERVILKPLDGFGGSGVIAIDKSFDKNINPLLDLYIHGRGKESHVIAQELVEGADQGDIRIMLLNGKTMGAIRRVPASTDIRSNINVGGTSVKHDMSAREHFICEKIGPRLAADGLYFVGIDVIGGKIIEINVVSPGGIPLINETQGINIQREFVNLLEEKVTAIKNRKK